MPASPSDESFAGDGRFDRRPATVRQYLRWLKQRGAALLFTGAVSAATRERASRRYLGDARPPEVPAPRRRVLVCTDAADGPGAYLPPFVDPTDEHTRVVCEPSVVAGDRDGVTVIPEREGADRVRALRRAATAAVRDLAADLDERARATPGTLRVGVTSVEPLLATTGAATVRAFAAALADAVRDHGGMLHVHLPLGERANATAELSGFADARVELRERYETVEQRFHLPYPELDERMEWLEL